jgi:hypothetical protein
MLQSERTHNRDLIASLSLLSFSQEEEEEEEEEASGSGFATAPKRVLPTSKT